MKKILLLGILLLASIGYAQNLPFDFETTPTVDDFVDFDGGMAAVIANPQMNADNSSTMVAQIVRDGGAVWAGSKIILDGFLDFSTNQSISMKVFSPVAGIVVKFKLEGNAQTERDVQTTVANQWETLTWDFTGEPSNTYNEVVFMFDFGNTGDGSANSTFLFDDVTQFDVTGGLSQIDLPLDFEDPTVFYGLTDFYTNSTELGNDPTNASNTVAITTKPETAGASAGTTMSTPAGFANPIPISATATKMTVRVYSPDANIPIRLKIEDHNDPTRSVETEVMNTVANQWETLEFDFNNEAPGTAALNLGYTFDMASIFFNFGTDGATAGEKIYYWDDVQFGEPTNTHELEQLELSYFPNPVKDVLQIHADQLISGVRVFNQMAQQVMFSENEQKDLSLDLSMLSAGVYFIEVKSEEAVRSFKIEKVN